MGKLSWELQRRLIKAGLARNGHVSREGTQLITELAARRGWRDWPNTRTATDYARLIMLFKP